MAGHRIVSLIPSATEIVAALGCADALVGRSHECDFPPSVVDLPVCTQAKIDVQVTGREIDRQVRTLVEQGLSVYRVLTEVLERLDPTLIVTQSQCEVCAVSLDDVERAVQSLAGCKARVVSLAPMSLADVWQDVLTVAEALGRRDAAEALLETYRSRLDAIRRRTQHVAAKQRVAMIEWIDPLMSAGNWVPELVELAGGTPMLSQAGAHSPWLSWDALVEADPDVLIVIPCGFDIARTQAEMPQLVRQPCWDKLSAVRRECVFIADGNQYFNRPGPRLVESAEILAEILHPEQFDFGHGSAGWIRFY